MSIRSDSVVSDEQQHEHRRERRHDRQAEHQRPEYLRVCMVRLRRKLEVDPSRPRWLVTEIGVGHRMRDGSPPNNDSRR